MLHNLLIMADFLLLIEAFNFSLTINIEKNNVIFAQILDFNFILSDTVHII